MSKAKCPACWDEEGVYMAWSDTSWRCGSCNHIAPVSEWFDPEPTRLHPSDIEAIAQRVAELVKG